jgi:phosphatidylinositol alpha-1,6-mannosyltransferase
MDTDIARVLGEVARHYPAGSLMVSTGETPGWQAFDAGLANRVDRVRRPARRLRTVTGLLLWSRQVAALTRTARPDFVWSGNLKPAAYPARWISERLGIPYGVLVYGHDLLLLQHQIHQSRMKLGTARSLLGSASLIVAFTTWARDLCGVMLGQLGLPDDPERVRLVPLATDPDRFRPGPPDGPTSQRLGLPPGRWLLTSGGPAPQGTVSVALRALAKLASGEPDLRLAVLARGDPGLLEAMAGDLGVAGRVHFLRAVTERDLPEIHRLATVYLGGHRGPADGDSLGLSLFDALASGTPVVAGRHGVVPDGVRDGEAAVLLPGDDPETVAAAVAALLADPDRARALGAGGRRVVETFYHWDRVVADLRDLASGLRPPPGSP